jgi:trans-2-enoyl-CoA reductase
LFSKGDVIVQDDASSPVGLAVVQMAKAMGVTTINVVGKTNYVDYKNAAAVVKGMGGDIVVLESYVGTDKYAALISDLSAPKLAFSAAGGSTASSVVGSLSGGKVIVYGAKSADPIVVPAGSKVALEGFWLDDKSAAERTDIISKVAGQEVNVWYECNDMLGADTAIQYAAADFGDRTPMLMMNLPAEKVYEE